MKLTQFQLGQAKSRTDKHISGAFELRKENKELKEKMRLYLRLIEEQKLNIEKTEAEANQPEDLHEISVTRKLGHTDIGDISDILEVGSAVNKSQETDHYISRAEIPGQHSMIHIKKMDFSRDSIDVNRDDISDRSHAPPPNVQVNLSSSFAGGAVGPRGITVVNTAASVHLRDAMNEVKGRKGRHDIS